MLLSSPPTYLPTHLFAYLFAFAPFYLLAHPSIYLLIYPCTFLPINPLGKYILNPTYMARPNYLVNTPTNLAITKNDEEKNQLKVLHGAWTCSFKTKSKGMIKLFVTTHIRILQICIGLKHYVLWVCEGITHIFEKTH
jgi:hypothetical protein